MEKKASKEEVKWYGLLKDGRNILFKDLESRYIEIFSSLRNGKVPEISEGPGKIPDLKPLLIEYGKERIKEEFTRDQYLRRVYYLIPELNKSINLIFEKMTVLTPFIEGKNNANDPCGFFRSLSGTDFPEYSRKIISEISEAAGRLCSLKSQIADFLRGEIVGIMPNTSALAGVDLAIELLSKGGSLENLSKMSGSSIQVLGAEKALFKHIVSGTLPPKHGVIFRFPGLSSLRPKDRGRVARVAANQIALTLRADMAGTILDLQPLREKIAISMKKKQYQGSS